MIIDHLSDHDFGTLELQIEILRSRKDNFAWINAVTIFGLAKKDYWLKYCTSLSSPRQGMRQITKNNSQLTLNPWRAQKALKQVKKNFI